MKALRLRERKGTWLGLTALVVAAGSVLRLGHLLTPRIDADMAVFGLQGMHVLKGELPVFGWGYAYGGTLQSFIDAAFFAVLGPSRTVLNFVPFLFWIGYLVAIHRVAVALFVDRRQRLLVLALACVSPWFFTVTGVMSRHGYPETYCFGTVMLAMMCTTAGRRTVRGHQFLLFLIAGIAWWSNFLIAYYFVPLGAYWLHSLIRADRWRERGLLALESTAGFVLGSLPFWVYNVSHGWASLEMFGAQAPPRDFAKVLDVTVRQVFPVLFGARIWASGHAVPVLWVALTVFWTAAILFVLARYAIPFVRSSLRKELTPQGIVWLLLVSIFGIYLGTHFASETDPVSIRYLIPFYTLYPLVPGLLLDGLPERLRGRWFGWLGGFLILMLLANNLLGNPLANRADREVYRAAKAGEEAILRALEGTGERQFILNDYWRAPVWTFDSRERLIVAEANSRYPRYIAEMLREPSVNLLVSPMERERAVRALATLGVSYRSTPVAGMVMLSDFRPLVSGELRALPGGTATVSAVRCAPGEARAVDDDIATSWAVRTGEGPALVRIALDRPRPIRGLAIHLGDRLLQPALARIRDGRGGKELLSTGAFSPGFTARGQPLLPVLPDHLELFFPVATTDLVELELTGAKGDRLLLGEIVPYEDAGGDPSTCGACTVLPGPEEVGPPGTAFRVAASVGTFARAEDLFPRAEVAMSLLGTVDLDLRIPNVLFFEVSWLDHNRALLDRIGIDYRAWHEGEIACIVTKPHPWKRIRMAGKGLFAATDRKRADGFFRKAERAREQGRRADEATMLERTLFFHPAQVIARGRAGAEGEPGENPAAAALFGDRLALRAASIGGSAATPGGTIDVAYRWLVERTTGKGIALFVHFTDGNGRILFQDDHPLDGRLDERSWFRGEAIEECRRVTIPPGIAYRGPVGVWLGVVDPGSGKRWAVATSLPRDGKKVKIGSLELR